MKVLILANSRYKGGISGSDAIYENFKKYWDCDIKEHNLIFFDYKPFFLCYLHRIIHGCIVALFDRTKYDFVYSSSDFLPDVLPAYIYKRKGIKWVAGFYLNAFGDKKIYKYIQDKVKILINKFADMVIVTNPSMYNIFPDKIKTWVNGGIDTKLAGLSNDRKIYDVVFCGRIHPSKGIDDLMSIWEIVNMIDPRLRLAVIGDGDLGVKYLKRNKDFLKYKNVDIFGYMGEERYKIYKKSKVVIYPVPNRYSHFSMAPVEAMACGCPMITWCTDVMTYFDDAMGLCGCVLIEDEKNNRDYEFFAKVIYEYITSGEWTEDVLIAEEWAKNFDYKKQSLRVLKDLRKGLMNEGINNRPCRDGRKSSNKTDR